MKKESLMHVELIKELKWAKYLELKSRCKRQSTKIGPLGKEVDS